MQRVKYQGKNQIITANLRDEADESVWNEIFKYREYRRVDDIIKTAKNTIIDVGAHAGFFSLYTADLNSKIKIFALEPEPNNLEALENNLKLNKFDNIIIKPLALAKNSGQRLLAIMEDNHNHYLADENEELDRGVVVEINNLKDFCKKNNISRISLLKMDIEGNEYEIINSLDLDDYNKTENIIMEYHNYNGKNYKELESILRKKGFGVQIFPSKFDKNMGFLFANNKKLPID